METVSVEQAAELILERTKAIEETEEVKVEDALGRILAGDMKAEFDNPPFDRSPIDGYACRSADIAGASEEHPVRLKVVEEVFAACVRRIRIMEKRWSVSSGRKKNGETIVPKEKTLKPEVP